jgi:hypothetical protein
VDFSFDTIDYSIDRYLLAISASQSVADSIATIGAAVGWTGVGAAVAVAAELYDLFAQYIVLDMENTKLALGDPATREAASCDLYCRVKANGLVLSEEVYENWLDDLGNGGYFNTGFLGSGLKASMESIWTYARILSRFNVYARDLSNICEALCDECADEPAVCEPGPGIIPEDTIWVASSTYVGNTDNLADSQFYDANTGLLTSPRNYWYAASNPATLTIDLGSVKSFSRLVLGRHFPSEDNGWDNTVPTVIQVYVANTQSDLDLFNPIQVPINGLAGNELKTFDIGTQSGQWVRLHVTSSGIGGWNPALGKAYLCV